eukprot:2539795-Prymnesium_polylepis.1
MAHGLVAWRAVPSRGARVSRVGRQAHVCARALSPQGGNRDAHRVTLRAREAQRALPAGVAPCAVGSCGAGVDLT